MTSLIVDSITLLRGANKVLEDISFVVEAPSVVGIVGRNGVGKSTLLHSLSGRLRPSRGSISIFPAQPLRTIAQSVPMLEPQKGFSLKVFELLDLSRPKDKSLRARVLDDLALGSLCERDLSTLSSGERQRVLLASALLEESTILLCDEPSSFTDLYSSSVVWNTIRHHTYARKLLSFCVSHDISPLLRICDRLLVLSEGRLLADVNPRDNNALSILEKVFSTSLREPLYN
jgi:iron complex transport system ATP-binding protein